MRGEEVQLLGAIADGTVPPDCLVCHPGTHNKWAIVAGGRIQSFRTVMTGELYNLLREHSILSDLLQKDVEPGASFGDGVRQGLRTDGVVADLFSQRAGVLLGDLDRDKSASRISGLLIGADVRVGLAGTDDAQVIVMGRPELTELYAQAIEGAGRKSVQLDGEMCFLAGIRQIAERIPN
jgi:2-dehydro-3-deoxygalactonokinase